MSKIKLKSSSALNLELEGSVGSFSVGHGLHGQTSIEVKYFLTHVGLNFDTGVNAAVLSHLAPFREIFDTESLEFDEIMQRDIDDARVSSELIPYLLDARSRDLVKIFPPIIVVVLPVKSDANRPDDLYPPVKTFIEPEDKDSHALQVTRSGDIGKEVFQFEQPIEEDKIYEHDLCRLKLNTHKCKLVIVDGQHRAMALLAIYRNLQQEWTDARRAPFKDYYEEWTPKFIRQFQLEKISLPVMFCTFPQLDRDYVGDYDLKKAARSIFLTLNKTARKVSDSRNKLLDDNDLVALFLRETLSKIKQNDRDSLCSLRIHNIELDQIHDRIKIDSPIAITGVNHIYYMIEHLLLNKADEDVNGAKPRSGKFYKRKDLEMYRAFERLDGRNILGSATADLTTREFYTSEAGDKLSSQFSDRIGSFIISAFEKFKPFEKHNRAVLELSEDLRIQENQKIRPIIFEGQGISRVFNKHREMLREKINSGDFSSDIPQIKEIADRLDATAILVANSITKFRNQRAKNFLSDNNDKSLFRKESSAEYTDGVVSFLNGMYENVFSTVAFQTALLATFFGEIEKSNTKQKKAGALPIETEQAFNYYIEQLSSFFCPNSNSRLRHLIEAFAGDINGEIKDWKITPSPKTFREVVYRGEMQPDQWPKYKYLILEIWKPNETSLHDCVNIERNKCRSQVFNSLIDDRRKDYLQRNLKREENLTPQERNDIEEDAYSSYKALLNNLGWKLSEIPSRNKMRQLTVEDLSPADVGDNGEEWNITTETT